MEPPIQNSMVLDELDQNYNASFLDPVTTTTEAYQPLIPDGAMWYLNVYINGVICGITAMFGAINNVINLMIFFKMGLKDSMTVCLFSLALTDLLLSVVVMMSRAFPIWDAFFSTDYIDPTTIWYAAFDWLSDSLFFSSGWITTFLAIERCVCVTFPFKVKQIFTRNRAVLIILLINVANACIYVPIYATHHLQWVTSWQNQTVNGTETMTLEKNLEVTFSGNRFQIEAYHSMINGHLLPILSLFLIIGSVIWMTHGLYRSSQIRQAMTQKQTLASHEKRGNGDKNQDKKLNFKTRRLVKVVLILAIVFMLCNLPRTFAMHMHLLNPEVRPNGKEQNMCLFQWHFVSFATVVNASVNIFVYLTINSSYRAIFKELFCGNNKRQS